jgi:hypothetical protein
MSPASAAAVVTMAHKSVLRRRNLNMIAIALPLDLLYGSCSQNKNNEIVVFLKISLRGAPRRQVFE